MKLIMENWKRFLNEEPVEEWTKEQVKAILAGDDPGPEKSEMFASPPEAPAGPACDPEEDAIDVRILDAAAAALEGSDLADQIDCLKKQIVRAFEGDDEGEDYGGEREKNIAGVFGQVERLVREVLNEKYLEKAALKKESKKASKSVGDPPYRERGSTESQAQQMAAGAALSARRGDTPVSKLKGASKDLYSGEISTKDLRNLAKLGQKVKGHKSKEPKHRKSLPGHAKPAKD